MYGKLKNHCQQLRLQICAATLPYELTWQFVTSLNWGYELCTLSLHGTDIGLDRPNWKKRPQSYFHLEFECRGFQGCYVIHFRANNSNWTCAGTGAAGDLAFFAFLLFFSHCVQGIWETICRVIKGGKYGKATFGDVWKCSIHEKLLVFAFCFWKVPIRARLEQTSFALGLATIENSTLEEKCSSDYRNVESGMVENILRYCFPKEFFLNVGASIYVLTSSPGLLAAQNFKYSNNWFTRGGFRYCVSRLFRLFPILRCQVTHDIP